MVSGERCPILISPDQTKMDSKPEITQSHSHSHWWIYATVMLCSYGFFKEFKPSEAFLTPYLTDNSTNSSKNFTQDQVNSEIYPFWSYSFLIVTLFVFLFTDVLHYKPVIMVEVVAYLSTRVLLIWGNSVFAMQMMEVAYGIVSATEIAYYSYIYAAVPIVQFKKVTSYVRAARLLGQSAAFLIGQILFSTKTLDLLELNYFSFASICVASVFALLLPNICVCPCSCREQQRRSPGIRDGNIGVRVAKWTKRITYKRWGDFKKFYSVPSLLKWSIWWALATCGWLQVGNYVQSLWKEVATSAGESYDYNGLVEGITTLCGAVAAFVLQFMKVNWPVWGELTIGCLSLLDSVVLLIASQAPVLWLAYTCHIVYSTTFAFLITIATAQLAYAVDHDSYAFIFGFNMFLAIVLQTALTFTVADEHGLNLDIRTQFVVYSGYYYFMTLIFVAAGVYKLTSTGWFRSFRICFQESIPQSCPDSIPPEEERGLIQGMYRNEPKRA